MNRRIAAVAVLTALTVLTGCRRHASRPAAEGNPDQPATVSCFFPSTSMEYLEAEARDVLASPQDLAATAKSAVDELLLGPAEDGHTRVIPKETQLRGVTVAGKVATVDLSADFVDKFKGGSNIAALAVYSVVDTVASNPGIKQVQILIEGQPRADFAGAVDLSQPLSFDPKLIGGEKLNP
jgi:spore germination protein GerM